MPHNCSLSKHLAVVVVIVVVGGGGPGVCVGRGVVCEVAESVNIVVAVVGALVLLVLVLV